MDFLNYLANNSFYFLIALGVFLLLVLVVCLVSRQTISEATVIYCGLLFLIIFAIYSTGYAYKNNEYSWTACVECLHASIKSFGFEMKTDIVKDLMAVDKVYSISVVLSIFFSGVTLVIGIIELATAAILNKICSLFKMVGLEREIVLGYTPEAVNYCKNNKKAILWIDSNISKITKDERKKLFRSGVLYIYKPFTTKQLRLVTLFVFKTIFVVCFQENNEHLHSIFDTLEGFKATKKTYKFHVQTSSEHMDFVNIQLTNRCKGKGKIMAMTFEYHELISRNFALEHNLAYYLPRDFYNERKVEINGEVKSFSAGTIKSNKNINVVIIGYGKTGKAVLKSILLNNHFVEAYGDFYCCKKINIDIYDLDEKSFDDPVVSHVRNYNELCEKDFFNFDEQLEPFEMTANITPHVYNVKTDANGTFYSSLKNTEDTFTFYIVSLADTTDNLLVAERILRVVNAKSSTVFYNVDYASEQLKIKNDNCIPFGFKSEIFSHENIAVENLIEFAQIRNEVYGDKALTNIGFYELPIIEKMSNIYDAINHRFKLNLLGLDYTLDSNAIGITKEEYLKYYEGEIPSDYNDYFTLNLRNALIYQEHLRWAMIYFLQDFKGMKLKDFEVIKKVSVVDGKEESTMKIVHKNVSLRKHACLTSFKGLDFLHRYELDLFVKAGFNKTINDVETFKYDIKLEKAYDILTKLGYKVVKLNR